MYQHCKVYQVASIRPHCYILPNLITQLLPEQNDKFTRQERNHLIKLKGNPEFVIPLKIKNSTPKPGIISEIAIFSVKIGEDFWLLKNMVSVFFVTIV